MEKASGGVPAALTKEEFLKIRDSAAQIRSDSWLKDHVDRLIAEIERVNPDWLPDRYIVTCYRIGSDELLWTEGYPSLDAALEHLRESANFGHKIVPVGS